MLVRAKHLGRDAVSSPGQMGPRPRESPGLRDSGRDKQRVGRWRPLWEQRRLSTEDRQSPCPSPVHGLPLSLQRFRKSENLKVEEEHHP